MEAPSKLGHQPAARILVVEEADPSAIIASLHVSLQKLAVIGEITIENSPESFINTLQASLANTKPTGILLDQSALKYLPQMRSAITDPRIAIVAVVERCEEDDLGPMTEPGLDAIITLNCINGAEHIAEAYKQSSLPAPQVLELTIQESGRPESAQVDSGRAIDVLAGDSDLPIKDLVMVRDAILKLAERDEVKLTGAITEVRYRLHPDLLPSARPLLNANLPANETNQIAITVEPAGHDALPDANSALGVVLGKDHENSVLALSYIRHNIPILAREDSSAVTLFQRTASNKDYRRYIWESGGDEERDNLVHVMVGIIADSSSAQKLATDLRFGLAEISSPDACSAAIVDFLAQLDREHLLRNRAEPRAAPSAELRSNMNIHSILGARTDTLLQLGTAQYELGRRAADRGAWSESFRHHSAALVCFNEVGLPFWQARTAGRLAWIEIAEGRYANAYAFLSDAAEIDLLQGGANYLWAAQYAMRCHEIETARRMLRKFVQIARPNAFPFPLPPTLAQADAAAFEAVIVAIRDFYQIVVKQARDLGFEDLCLSDEGRLHVLEAVIADDIDSVERELGMAAVCFSTVGLMSYAEFCDGRRLLLLACTSAPELSGAYLDRAITTLGKVQQRFPGERDVLGALLATANSHRSILRFVEQLRVTRDEASADELEAITSAMTTGSEAFGVDFRKTFVEIFLAVRRAAEGRAPPDADLSLRLGLLFRRLYNSIPTIDAFYSPQFRALLLAAMRSA